MSMAPTKPDLPAESAARQRIGAVLILIAVALAAGLFWLAVIRLLLRV